MIVLHILGICSAVAILQMNNDEKIAKTNKDVDKYNGGDFEDIGSSYEAEVDGSVNGTEKVNNSVNNIEKPNSSVNSTEKSSHKHKEKIVAKRKDKITIKGFGNGSNTDTASGALLKQGKDLIVEGLKKIEKSNDIVADNKHSEYSKSKDTPQVIKKSSKVKMVVPARLLNKPSTSQSSVQSTPATNVSMSEAPSQAQEGPIKKLTDLLFKSSVVTKNDMLTSKESATLLENNVKIKNMMTQLQKIYEMNEGILKRFINNQEEQPLPYHSIEKPKDVMKYQVIEVTEKNK